MKKFDTKTTGIIRASDLKKPGGKIIYWISFFILAFIGIISLLPTVWTVFTAFKDTQEIYQSTSFFPKDLSWHRIVSRISDSWRDLQLGNSIVNTCILSVGELLFNLIFSGLGGYVLSRLKPRGSKLLFALVVWTMMMPGQIRMVPNYMTYLHFPFASEKMGGINLLDTFWPMWLTAGGDTFAVLLFKNAFDSLSISYVESAKLDGCTNLGIFFKIMLPLSMPIVIYQSITVLSMAWSNFFTPMLVLDKKVVLPLKVYRMQSDTTIQKNTYFMGLVFSSIPPFLIFAVFQKRILGGINIGGVKG